MILPHPPTGYQRTPFSPPPLDPNQPTTGDGPGSGINGPGAQHPLTFLSKQQIGGSENSPITQLGWQQQIDQYKRELADQRKLAEEARKQQEDILKQFQDQTAQSKAANRDLFSLRLSPIQQGAYNDYISRGYSETDAFNLAKNYVQDVPSGGQGSEGSSTSGEGPGDGPGPGDGGPGPGDSSTGP